jgi:O-antigen/teichoic acid export membrane protein
MVAFRWVDRLIGLVSIAILARLLRPDDFGIVAYAMLFIGLLELFAATSTDTELIRHKAADSAYLNAAWTINILRGLALAALMLAFAQTVADFFHEPRLTVIIWVLAAMPLLGALENVGVVEFRKNLEFDREFRFLLVTRILGTLSTLALAFALRTYWALAIGSVLRVAFRTALSFRVHPFRPRLSVAKLPEIFRFSRWMMIQNLAAGVYDRLPGLLIGRELSSSALAFFNVGKEIADLSTTELRAPIRRVLYPGLATLSQQGDRVADILVESTGMLALLTLPISLGIALVAEDLVPLFLGEAWRPAIGVLQPLAVAVAITSISTNSQLAYLVLNRAHLAAIAGSLRLLVLMAVLAAIMPLVSLEAMAYAVAGVSSVMIVVEYALVSRILEIDVRRFLAVVWRPIVAGLAMCAAVWLVRTSLVPASGLPGHARSLATCALVGSVAYAVTLAGLWNAGGRRNGAERRLLSLLSGYRRRAQP